MRLQEGELPGRVRVAEATRVFAALHDRPDDWRAVPARWGLETGSARPGARVS
ncbi:hypothetical protein [Nonomuraea aridisoli]|uniref:hypothetical protein n=1 Tax=Nonomuraea aridisoli TaxID=2070368 RepID=UPI0015E8BD76|nr:hypothetical protein [Nonomuraea aridisoli]